MDQAIELGSIVKVIKEFDQCPVGTVGEVVDEQSNFYGLKFDKEMDWASSLSGRVSEGYGYWVAKTNVVLHTTKDGVSITSKVIEFKRGMNITEYVKKILKVETDKDRLKWLRTFEMCVLSPEVKDAINEALVVVLRKDMFDKWGINDHFEKGLTNSILLHGPPGTGKTMISECIAAVLNLNLIKIDNAAIQSNVPGQTERNIQKAFAQAKKENAVLLLDECDSLLYDRDSVGAIFGAEINQLLTEIERFDGVVILTTNRIHQLDSALNRRIIAKVELGIPDQKTRELIWQKLMPVKMPLLSKIDYKSLSIPEIAGGDIKNAILLAARKALAKNKDGVGMIDLLEALTFVVKGKKQFEDAAPLKGTQGLRMFKSVGVGVDKVRSADVDKVRGTGS